MKIRVWNRNLFYIYAILTIPLLLTGCIAVWGAAHKVVKADETEIVIQYDPFVTSSVRAMVLAKEHCKKYEKTAVPEGSRMAPFLLGIIEETYSCKVPDKDISTE
jgi:aspartate 1-decarboxylase